MPSNVEIKAKITNYQDFLTRAKSLSDTPESVLVQQDTYFKVQQGRLKLREIEGDCCQLVYYDRPDDQGPKLSNYNKQDFKNSGEAKGLKAVLESSIGIRGIVRKKRSLLMIGQTRVHVDDVEELGQFMELEVVLKEGQSLEDGEKIAEDLMVKLAVKNENLLCCSYIDMILCKT